MNTSGEFLYHEPCPNCGSKDNVGVYKQPDGVLNGWCFGCESFFPNWKGDQQEVVTNRPKITYDIDFIPLRKRGIDLDTCIFFQYGVMDYKGQTVQVAPYRTKHGGIAYKCRTASKDFFWLGDNNHVQLFGQHLWSNGGKRLVITEGEIDALSVSQVFNNSWAVVSIPNGSTSYKSIKENLEWVESFEKVVAAFDQDDAGRRGLDKLSAIITPGKLHMVNWGSAKDANEVLVNQGPEALRKCILFKSEVYRPDGIISGTDVPLDDLLEDKVHDSYEISYPVLNKKLQELRKHELTMIIAGSGAGKSTFVRELAYDLLERGARIGYIALEESIKKTSLGFIALDNNVPLGKLYMDRSILPKESIEKSYHKIFTGGKIFLYDHFGSLESRNLLNKIKYMSVALGVDYIFLDHISIVVSGSQDDEGERRMIDKIMTDMRSIVENTGVGAVVVSHVKNKHGKGAEEGAQISISDGRGSGSLKQLSDNVIALERDMSSDTEAHISKIRLLKNRLMSEIGMCDVCEYDLETGRLLPISNAITDTYGSDF